MERIEHRQLGETLYYEELPNGLQVYVLPKPGFFKTYATFTTHYGSIDNHFQPPGKGAVRVPDGIAHFLEHKMFEKEDGDVFQHFAAQEPRPMRLPALTGRLICFPVRVRWKKT